VTSKTEFFWIVILFQRGEMGNCYSEPPFNDFPSTLEQTKSIAKEVEQLNKNIEKRVAEIMAKAKRREEELAHTRGEGPGTRYSGGP